MRFLPKTIRAKLLCGFIAIIAAFSASAGVAMVLAQRSRTADVARTAAFADLSQVMLTERQIATARRSLTVFRGSGAASDRDAFLAAVTGLSERLAGMRTEAPDEALQGAGKATAAAIVDLYAATGALTAATGALGTPIAALAEAASRSSDATLLEQVIRLQGSYAVMSGAVGRSIGTELANDAAIIRDELGRMQVVLQALETNPAATPRMRRMIAGIVRDLGEYNAAQQKYDTALTVRAARTADVMALFAKHAEAIEAARLAADASFTETRQEVERANAVQHQVLLGGSIATTVFGLILAFVIGRATTRPIIALGLRMNAMAAGELAAEMPGTARRDETGAMARAAETFRQDLQRGKELEHAAKAARTAAEEARVLAQRDLADRVERELAAVVRRLNDLAEEQATALAGLSAGVEATAGRAVAVAGGASETTGNVQTVAAASEELASSVQEITRQVADASRAASQAVADADSANQTIQNLSDAAARIGDVVRMIGAIAGQTNLLALNATIEAARAGEAGKGFAVVAGEVKALASQTAKATDEIAAQVAGIQSATTRAVQSIQGIASVIGDIDHISTAIAAAVEEQGASTQEIARNITEAARGTQDVSANIAHVSKGVEQNNDDIRRLRVATEQVAAQGATLRETLSGLLQGLRLAS